MPLLHLPSLLTPINPDGKFSVPHVQLFTNLFSLINRGYPAAINGPNNQSIPQSITIVTAKLTVGGTEGSMTFTNGILTTQTPAT
jgi:hypothetical protein